MSLDFFELEKLAIQSFVEKRFLVGNRGGEKFLVFVYKDPRLTLPRPEKGLDPAICKRYDFWAVRLIDTGSDEGIKISPVFLTTESYDSLELCRPLTIDEIYAVEKYSELEFPRISEVSSF